MSAGVQSAAYEMASVLFMDIVSYSLRSIDDQTELLTELQEIVRESAEYKQALAKEELISLPTGDGMALVFLHDPVSPVRCALEVAAALRNHREIQLRMGVHTGPVRLHADIKQEVNVVGGGINMAQRVMDCGDAGHILLSRNVAEVLEQLRGWSGCLHDLGVHEVKHGVKVQVFNLCKDGLGNPAIPRKIAAVPKSQPSTVSTPAEHAVLPRSKWFAVIGAAIVLLAGASYFWVQKTHGAKTNAPAPALPQVQRTLTYYVTVQKYRDGKPYKEPFRLSGERIFEADYRIRLAVSSPEHGYLYVLNEGPKSTAAKPDLNTLFPSPLTRDGSAEVVPNQEIPIPSGGEFIFDKEAGQEKLWLIWSAAVIKEFEDLKKWINPRDRGAIGDAATAREVRALIEKYAGSKVETQRDESHQLTILTGTSDILAWMVPLQHD